MLLWPCCYFLSPHLMAFLQIDYIFLACLDKLCWGTGSLSPNKACQDRLIFSKSIEPRFHWCMPVLQSNQSNVAVVFTQTSCATVNAVCCCIVQREVSGAKATCSLVGCGTKANGSVAVV